MSAPLRVDLAMIKLKRTAPKQCVTGLRGGGGRSQGVELRIPLPEELKHGTAHGEGLYSC